MKIEYCDVILPYHCMPEMCKAQFGFIAKPNKALSIKELLAYEIELLSVKSSSVYDDYCLLLSDKYGYMKRIIRDGSIELINLETNNTISKRYLSCPI